MRRSLTIAALSLAALSAVGCDSSSSSSKKYAGEASPAACTHWANVRGDVSAGILTESELRAKVAEVRSSASSPKVESAATELLAGITSGSKTQIVSGVKALNSACG